MADLLPIEVILECLRALSAPNAAAVALHGRYGAFSVSAVLVPTAASGRGSHVAEWRAILAPLGLQLNGEPMAFASAGPVSMANAARHELGWGHALVAIEAPSAEEGLYPAQTLTIVRKATEAAVLSLSRQMTALTNSSKEQCRSLDNVVTHFSTEIDAPKLLVSSLAMLEEGAAKAYRTLEKRLLEHATQVKGAAQQADAVVSLAATIDSVAQAVRLVTVNAQIESARLGAAGKGFSIIAQQMRELSSQVRDANQSVTALAVELAETLPSLTTSAGQLAKDAVSDFSDLGQRLNRLRENFDAAQTTVRQSLAASQRSAAEVQSHAEAVTQELQFEDRVNQLLQHAAKQVQRLEALLGVKESVPTDLFERAGQVGRDVEGSSMSARMGSVQLF